LAVGGCPLPLKCKQLAYRLPGVAGPVETRERNDVLTQGLRVSRLGLGHLAAHVDLAVAILQWGATLGECPHFHVVKGRGDGPRRFRLSLRKHERLKVHVLWVARWWTLARHALQARF